MKLIDNWKRKRSVGIIIVVLTLILLLGYLWFWWGCVVLESQDTQEIIETSYYMIEEQKVKVEPRGFIDRLMSLPYSKPQDFMVYKPSVYTQENFELEVYKEGVRFCSFLEKIDDTQAREYNGPYSYVLEQHVVYAEKNGIPEHKVLNKVYTHYLETYDKFTDRK